MPAPRTTSTSNLTATQWQRRAEMFEKNVEELENKRQDLDAEVTSLRRQLKEKDSTIQQLKNSRQVSIIAMSCKLFCVYEFYCCQMISRNSIHAIVSLKLNLHMDHTHNVSYCYLQTYNQLVHAYYIQSTSFPDVCTLYNLF